MVTIIAPPRFAFPFGPIRGQYGIANKHLTFARNRAAFAAGFRRQRQQPIDLTGNPLAMDTSCSMCGASCCACLSPEADDGDLPF